MNFLLRGLRALAIVAASLMVPVAANAQSTIKLGVVGPMTGPFAIMGENWRTGIETYMAQHGDTVNGHKIEVIYRDTTGNPANAKQLVQELVVRDKVNFLGGFGLSPEGYASAPVITQTKTPAFLYHAASPGLTAASPYFVIMGQNIYTAGEVAAAWALKKEKKKAYIVVADYAPGHDVGKGFREYYERHGGTVVGEDQVPLNTVDFAPIAERVADAAPEVVHMFIPPGAPAVGMVKALAARGVLKNTIVIGQGEAEDSDLHLFDDSVLNFHSAIYYSTTLDMPENKAFVEAIKKKFGPDVLPSTFTLGAYDAMGLIYKAVSEMKGDKPDGDEVMKSLIDHTYTSPRGKVTINSNRQPIEDYVIRQVQMVDGEMRNVIIDTIPAVDPETFGKK